MKKTTIKKENIEIIHGNNEHIANVLRDVIVECNGCSVPYEQLTQVLIMAYIKLYNKTPHVIDLFTEGFYLSPKPYEEREPRYNDIDVNLSMLNIVNTYTECYYIRAFSGKPIIFVNNCIVYYDSETHSFYVLNDTDQVPEWLDKCVACSKDSRKRYFNLIVRNSQGFSSLAIPVVKAKINLETNYNDDLPQEELNNFIKSKTSGLALLSGAPGTGKTHYIRYLMHKYRKKPFILLDPSCFDYLTDASFIEVLLDNKDAVIILEDCEHLLTGREDGNNKVATLLNLSDGLLGDAFNFKFICTFNADIKKIDKALLRKGRMKLRYEFKALSVEKTKRFAELNGINIKEGESLTLGELYNYNVINDKTTKTPKKTIGFQID